MAGAARKGTLFYLLLFFQITGSHDPPSQCGPYIPEQRIVGIGYANATIVLVTTHWLSELSSRAGGSITEAANMILMGPTILKGRE